MQSINSHANSADRRSAGTEHRRRAFTLIELLVTIGIIVILISILIPVVSKIRTAAYTAQTQALISNISSAITTYAQNNGGALPGPIANDDIYTNTKTPSFTLYDTTGTNKLTADMPKISMSENLVLGLLGGLYVNTTVSPAVLSYDFNRVGQGPMGLNMTNIAVNRRAEPYIQLTSSQLSKGHFSDDAGSADDSQIPEILDSYPNQLPILFLRAKVGATTAGITSTDNPVITWDPTDAAARTGQYDLHQIYGYTSRTIGVKKLPTYYSKGTQVTTPNPPAHGLIAVTPAAVLNPSSDPNYYYPYDAYPYFKDPNSSSTNPTARMKDQFILISAGPDHIYGTKDDIVNFGDINP